MRAEFFAPVRDVMTPMPLITAPEDISRDDATAILRQHKRERLPLVDEQGRLAGLITIIVTAVRRSRARRARQQALVGSRSQAPWAAPGTASPTRSSGRTRRPASPA